MSDRFDPFKAMDDIDNSLSDTEQFYLGVGNDNSSDDIKFFFNKDKTAYLVVTDYHGKYKDEHPIDGKILGIAAKKEARGTGDTDKLISRAKKYFSNDVLVAEVDKDNIASQRLVRRNGFKKVFSDEYIDYYVWQRDNNSNIQTENYKMIKSYSRILNEGFNSYFKRLEESVQTIYDEYRNMSKEPIIEFPNGEYFYVVVDPETKSIYAGGATNTGVFREYEIDIDEDGTLDSNLESLYDYMIEENPELTYDAEDIDESLDDEYKTIAKLSGGLELIKYPYGYAISDGYTNDRLTVTDNGFQVDDGRFNLSNKDKNIINNCIKNGKLKESLDDTDKELMDWGKSMYGGWFVNYHVEGKGHDGKAFKTIGELRKWCKENGLEPTKQKRRDNDR